MSDANNNIKVGFYEEKDGSFTAFLRMQNLPDQETAIQAAEWLADTLINLAKPEEKDQNDDGEKRTDVPDLL